MTTTKPSQAEVSGVVSRVIHFSVYHPGIVLLLTLFAGVIGWFAFETLPIDAVPDVTNVQVTVNTRVEGFAPEENERNITFPIESALSGIAGVSEVRSLTRFGLSQVTVVFEDNVDIYRARQLVSERLQGALSQLPHGSQPKLGPISTGLGEIFHYAIEAEKVEVGEARIRQLMELRTLQDWYVKPRLLTTKGVAEVNSIGGYEKQYHVQPNPVLMARYGIHFSDITEALEKVNQNVGGGYITQTAQKFLVQGVGMFRNEENIRNVPIKALGTLRTLRISDVATVALSKEIRTGAALVRGKETVIGTVLMLSGENSRTVADRVSEQMKDIAKGLPPGYRIEALYNRSELVNATLNTVLHNLTTGAVLVIVVLLLLVGNLRAALISAVTIPLSLLVTFFIMRRFGLSGNLMSLGALDFGIIIDGAVIVLDNCVRFVHDRSVQLGRSLSKEERKTAVYEAASEIRTAAGFGEIIIIVVFLPILGLTGIEGKMFLPMAATFAAAVLAGLVLSFTTVPALAGMLLSGKVKESEPWLMKIAKRLYSPILSFALSRRVATIGVALVSVLGGILLFLRLGGEFLPQLDEGSLLINFLRPPRISLDQSIALQEKSEELLAEFPQVANIFSRIGTGEVAVDPMDVSLSDTFITLKPFREWPKDSRIRNKQGLTQEIVRRLEAEIPGQRALVTQPIQMRFNELLEGTRADVSVKVFGDDMTTLGKLTDEIADNIKKIPGSGEVELELQGTSPLLRIVPRTEALARIGVSDREVLETVGTAIGGEQVGFLYEGLRRFPIIVRLDEAQRSDLTSIRELPVGIYSNETIPLKKAAEVGFVDSFGTINREQLKRRAAIMINPRGRDTEGFVEEAQRQVASAVKLPPGYFVEWGGNFKNLQEAKRRLLVLVPLALSLVLVMVYAAFGNWLQTFLIFLCAPLALVGGVLGLTLNGLPFSISAGVGFIALSGIAVLNGVVLMNYFNTLRSQGHTGDELVRTGALIRLRPVLMTALVDIFGFLPMMLSTGMGAEVQRPLAAVVIGGIISSTLLTLVVVPILYRVLEHRMGPRNGIHSEG